MNRVFGLAVAISVAMCSMASAALVRSYDFNEESGTTLHDGVGTGNGTFQNGMTDAAWVPGYNGNALYFDGSSNHYVLIPGISDITQGSPFTISFWVYHESAELAMILTRPDMTTNRFMLRDDGSFLAQNSCDGLNGNCFSTNTGAPSSPDIPLNTWTHIVYQSSGTHEQIYINGSLNYQRDVPDAASTWGETRGWNTDVYMGVFKYSSTYYYPMHGKIDEMKIYNEVLSASQVADLYNEFNTPVPVAADWYEATGGIHYSDGNVGIGTDEPAAALHVSGTVGNQGEVDGIVGIDITNEASSGYAALKMKGGVGDAVSFKFTDIGAMSVMNIASDGADPFHFNVNGNITAKKLTITQEGWADFVFDPSYKLASLKDVERHIQKNKHLPAIPTAAEVAEEGVDVGEMQAKLLQKVEELTLYLIEQDKRIEKLEKENRELRDN